MPLLRTISGLLLMAAVTLAVAADLEEVTRWATPLGWWGLILALDGWLTLRRRRSPLLGRPRRLLAWAGASIAFWLLFEAYNLHLGNWHYLNLPSSPTQRLLGYLASYATVLPGVFLVTEVLTERRWFDRADSVGRRPRLPVPRPAGAVLVLTGAFCLAFPLLVPAHLARWGFGLVWLGFILVLDPMNRAAGRPSLLEDLSRGVWGRTLRLLAAGLLCGLLWEAWNWGAATKWVYTVPILPGVTLFEMPLAGFLGFPAFALELFTLWHALAGTARHLGGRSETWGGARFTVSAARPSAPTTPSAAPPHGEPLMTGETPSRRG